MTDLTFSLLCIVAIAFFCGVLRRVVQRKKRASFRYASIEQRPRITSHVELDPLVRSLKRLLGPRSFGDVNLRRNHERADANALDNRGKPDRRGLIAVGAAQGEHVLLEGMCRSVALTSPAPGATRERSLGQQFSSASATWTRATGQRIFKPVRSSSTGSYGVGGASREPV
jgi:hypothetical protein